MDEKKVDITKYPEGLAELTKQLKLPIPEDATAQRQALVANIISSLVRQ